MTSTLATGKLIGGIPSEGTVHMDFRFKAALSVFLLWTVLQVVIPMQFLSVELVARTEYLKNLLPVCSLMALGFLYLDKLRPHSPSLPFLLLSLFAVCNTLFRMLLLGANDLKLLSQPAMFFAWTFCMFWLTPSVFDSLAKVRRLLLYSMLVITAGVFLGSLWSYLNGFEMAASSRGEALRYSFVYLHPGYFGGICYSVLCGSLMLREMAGRRFEKGLWLLFSVVALAAMILADSRTYLLASSVLLFVYLWRRGGIYKYLSCIAVLCLALGGALVMWREFMNGTIIEYIDLYTSRRITVWGNKWGSMMGDDVGWKTLLGRGIYTADWGHDIVVAGGRVAQTFTRFAVDNVYLEMFIMHGLIGIVLLVWGLRRIIADRRILSRSRLTPGAARRRNLLSIAYGALAGVFVGALFVSSFPSFGSTINSVVFPASVASIYVVAREAKRDRQQTIE